VAQPGHAVFVGISLDSASSLATWRQSLEIATSWVGCDIMSPLQSSKLWQALRRKPQSQPDVKEDAPSRLPIKTTLPVEILEMIFAHLDFRTLLHCRSICRLWHYCIPGTSPILRHRLFLATARSGSHLKHFHIHGEGDEHATLNFGIAIADTFADNFDGNFYGPRDPQPVADYTVHPLKKERTDSLDKSTNLFEYNPLLFLNRSRAQLLQYKAVKAAINIKEYDMPLWLSTYATFPPARFLNMRFEWHNTRIVQEECIVTPHHEHFTIKEPGGVTMARVLDYVCLAMWWPAMDLERYSEGKRIRDVRLTPCEGGDIAAWNKELKDKEAQNKPELEEMEGTVVETTSLDEETTVPEPERILIDEETRVAAVATMALEEELRGSTFLPKFEWENRHESGKRPRWEKIPQKEGKRQNCERQ
jgi:hypothetical protein